MKCASFLLPLVGSALLVLVNPVAAQDKGSAPVGAVRTGLVNDIDPASRTIVVGDRTITFDPGLIVHGRSGAASVGPGSLKLNTPIRFKQTSLDGKPFTSEIWVLDSLPAEDAESADEEG